MTDIDNLPWEAVTSDADDVPFDALEQIAQAMPHDPAVLGRLGDIYFDAQDRDWREGGFEFVYVPGIIALAAERLAGDLLEQTILLVMDMMDKNPQGSDLDFEVLQYTLAAIGPAVLPRTVKRLRERNPTDSQCFHLRGLMGQLAQTDDPVLRQPAVDYCRETIDLAIAGKYDADLAVELAIALLAGSEPDLRDRLIALQRTCVENDNELNRAEAGEYREMVHVLDGEADFETLFGMDPRAPREWISHYQGIIREWRLRPQDHDDEGDEPVHFLDSPLPRDHVDRGWIQPIVNEQPKTGRNDPCVCGSEKKYKKCCGR